MSPACDAWCKTCTELRHLDSWRRKTPDKLYGWTSRHDSALVGEATRELPKLAVFRGDNRSSKASPCAEGVVARTLASLARTTGCGRGAEEIAGRPRAGASAALSARL